MTDRSHHLLGVAGNAHSAEIWVPPCGKLEGKREEPTQKGFRPPPINGARLIGGLPPCRSRGNTNRHWPAMMDRSHHCWGVAEILHTRRNMGPPCGKLRKKGRAHPKGSDLLKLMARV
ncbi:hypothetical protein CEXT_638601 [Caerostris extrusa]|uniref:Uncharacterized protein n=1 Tax=Caerostris extrusa TaxID=172846 RepID=A0AAV4PUN7_CAEEX|nr:hypothetical protein CEXT_638601 [Caerostris extrusa]